MLTNCRAVFLERFWIGLPVFFVVIPCILIFIGICAFPGRSGFRAEAGFRERGDGFGENGFGLFLLAFLPGETEYVLLCDYAEWSRWGWGGGDCAWGWWRRVVNIWISTATLRFNRAMRIYSVR